MDLLSFCRVCLNTNVHSSIESTPLEAVYENLTGMPFQTNNTRPLSACFMCYAQLLKIHKFMQKCLKAENLLTVMLNQLNAGVEIDNKAALIDTLSISSGLSVSPVETVSYIGDISIISEVKDEDIKHEIAEYKDADSGDIHATEVPVENEPESVSKTNVVANCVNYTKWVNIISDIEMTEASLSELNNDTYTIVNIKLENVENDDRNENDWTIAKNNTAVSNNAAKQLDEYNSNGQNGANMDDRPKEIVKKITKPKYSCDTCGKKFKQKIYLQRHASTHTSDHKCFTCYLCDKGFTRKFNLECHLRTHNGDKPYTCNLCNKSFIRKINLEYHNIIHTGEKPFACDWCQRRFNKKGNLVCHIRTHTGDKPFICHVCTKGYSNSSLLRTHIRIHTNEWPFRCTQCGKGFIRKQFLNRHLRFHTRVK